MVKIIFPAFFIHGSGTGHRTCKPVEYVRVIYSCRMGESVQVPVIDDIRIRMNEELAVVAGEKTIAGIEYFDVLYKVGEIFYRNM